MSEDEPTQTTTERGEKFQFPLTPTGERLVTDGGRSTLISKVKRTFFEHSESTDRVDPVAFGADSRSDEFLTPDLVDPDEREPLVRDGFQTPDIVDASERTAAAAGGESPTELGGDAR